MKTVAIVLAAGSGKRMGGDVKKQFLLLRGKPVLFYSLKVFQESFIDEIVLVTAESDIEYVRENIVDRFGLSKVKAIVPGGSERYHSVFNGLQAVERLESLEADARMAEGEEEVAEATYIFIHDGARPLIDSEILERAMEEVKNCGACVVGMPSKDTVKVADTNRLVQSTPNRSLVWNIQTPQVFEFELIKDAYADVVSREEELKARGVNITDDAMVLEEYSGHPNHPIKLVEGSYRNIKVTTPEDLILAEALMNR